MSQELSDTPKNDRNQFSFTLSRSPDSEEETSPARQGPLDRLAIRRESLPLFSLRNRDGATYKDVADLHPYVQTLTIADLESCIALENTAFPPEERCSPEKFLYRLTTCPELCLGIYSTSGPNDPQAATPTYQFARTPDSATPARRGVLLGHVIATKCESPTVTDASVDYPRGWQSAAAPMDFRGHQEYGRTIAIHSLAVLPTFRKRGLGKIMMKSYEQRIENSGIADRMSLIAHDDLIRFYENLGFVNKGVSQCQHGAGGWFDFIYECGSEKPPPPPR